MEQREKTLNIREKNINEFLEKLSIEDKIKFKK